MRKNHFQLAKYTQFSPEERHSKLGQTQVADAILDCIVHDSFKILVDGDDSMGERHGLGDLNDSIRS